MFSFYVDENPAESGRDPEQIWNRDGFEHGYENIGYHESGAEFDTQLGYPAELSNFIFERVKKRMVEWIVPAADHSILDIGCGAGYLLYLIYEKYRRHGFTPTVTGVDISTFQLSYMARRMHKEGIYDAVVVHGNGEYLPFANNSFDFVTCSEVLEHIRNPNRALSEMHRVLKPAGRVLLSTPSMTAEKGWTLLLSPAAVLVKAIRGHKSESPVEDRGFDVPWYPKEFKKAIRFAGFEINDFEYNAVIPHPWYFKFLPKLFVKPVIGGFGIVDHYLKFMLRPLALHFVVRASKVVDSGKNR
jgi:SAM-dependent methyltransferase